MQRMSRLTPVLLSILLGLSAVLLAAPVAAAPQEPAEEPTGHAALDTARLAGTDRYGTAAAVSQAFWPDSADMVFVARGDDFPDALAAGPAARAMNAPLLLTKPYHIPQPTLAEIDRLSPREIVVVGGPGAISEGVREYLAGLAPDGATRVGGADRYETAALLVETYIDAPAPVFVATGQAFPDALSAGAAAAAVNGALLLSRYDEVPASTLAQVERLTPDYIYVAGLTGALSAGVEQTLSAHGQTIRVGGQDRYATAVEISKAIYPNGSSQAFVATGTKFPDALAASPAAGLVEGPLLLASTSWIPAWVTGELDRIDPDTTYIVGGEGVLSAGVESYIAGIGSSGCTAGGKPPVSGVQVFDTIPGATNQVALTFDMNGPTTPSADLARYLVNARVCSTIFVQGDISQTAAGQEVLGIIAANPDVLELGNHTYNHCDLVDGDTANAACPNAHASDDFVVQELTATNDVVVSSTGMSTVPYWRPPFGAYDTAVINAAASAGYTKTFHWSIDTRDWEHETAGGPTTQEMVNQVVGQATDGSIVLMHVGGYNTPEAVPLMVEGLRDRGFMVTSLSDMLSN